MEPIQIVTQHAPAAIGPYSQAVRCGQLLFTAGQLARDPSTGEIVGSDIQTQTHRVLQNLQAVLSAAGTSLGKVVKTTVFLATMSDYLAMNDVYASYFSSGIRPARSTMAAAELPRQALIEIECIALIED